MNRVKRFTRTVRKPVHRWRTLRRMRSFQATKPDAEAIADFAMEFGGHGFFIVRTVQIPWEIRTLARRVKSLNPKRILEIGTAYGGTLFIWAQLARDQVISCDLQDMGIQGTQDLSVKRTLFPEFPPPGSSCRVTFLEGDSHQPETVRRVEGLLEGHLVDFLFIDGDHSERGVEADYRDYRHLVRPGGLIAFHDIVDNQPTPGNQVQHFWKRLREEVDTEEIVADREQCGFGIGLVKVS